ncbi:hypothetical protein MA16_Dca007357 [Dendrobium catenatum]|uniref:Uncharacterized protein n=1 Tax=Dendrobium catenatum TaxID=906689 RepID=A0A2I0W8L0_9ASPA|nr:hypothetical protein MA16_Dca007357 [Dendrobium catenatum]
MTPLPSSQPRFISWVKLALGCFELNIVVAKVINNIGCGFHIRDSHGFEFIWFIILWLCWLMWPFGWFSDDLLGFSILVRLLGLILLVIKNTSQENQRNDVLDKDTVSVIGKGKDILKEDGGFNVKSVNSPVFVNEEIENLGSDLDIKSPEKQQVEVNLFELSLKTNNKFDVLAAMEESNLNVALECQEFGCAEEGEIVENIPHNMSNVEAMYDVKTMPIHTKDKDVYNSEKSMVMPYRRQLLASCTALRVRIDATDQTSIRPRTNLIIRERDGPPMRKDPSIEGNVNKFVGIQEDNDQNHVSGNLSTNFENDVEINETVLEKKEDPISNDNFVSAWKKTQHIKLNYNMETTQMTGMGLRIWPSKLCYRAGASVTLKGYQPNMVARQFGLYDAVTYDKRPLDRDRFQLLAQPFAHTGLSYTWPSLVQQSFGPTLEHNVRRYKHQVWELGVLRGYRSHRGLVGIGDLACNVTKEVVPFPSRALDMTPKPYFIEEEAKGVRFSACFRRKQNELDFLPHRDRLVVNKDMNVPLMLVVVAIATGHEAEADKGCGAAGKMDNGSIRIDVPEQGFQETA